MSETTKFLPPAPGEVIDGALGVVEDVAVKAQEIARNDPVALGAGLVEKTARRMREDLK